MSLSRRRFLTILLVVTAGVATCIIGYRRALGGALRGALGAAFRWLATPDLGRSPTGPLDALTLRTLLATTEAFAGSPVEESHYADFFGWHAENLPGYKSLYERFAVTVDASAKRFLGCGFAECGAAGRRRILEPAYRVLRAQGRWERLRLGVRDRSWVRFTLYVVRPIAAVFAATDAWRLAGYDAWPGTPRGLERYTRPASAKAR